MQPPNPVGTWSEYYRATIAKPLHPLYSALEPHLPPAGCVAELGFGVGHGVLWFLDKGFEVLAVDASEEAAGILESRVPDEQRGLLTIRTMDLTEFEPEPESFDGAVAGFCLFFLPRDRFDATWRRIGESVRQGGLFMGQLMGPNDTWADRMTTHRPEEARALFGGWDVLHWEEADQDGSTSVGVPKHWHIFHVVARKR